MTGVVACIVCARPLDSLLTSGLQAGVFVMAVVAIVVMGALARGVARLVRDDAERLLRDAAEDVCDVAGHDARAPVGESGGQP